MLFFKPKAKPNEILPPPPPFPSLELEEELEGDEFGALVKDLDKELKPKKVQKKLKKMPLNKLTKLLTKKLTKEKKPTIKKKIKKSKIKFPELEESLELEGLDFKLPKELEKPRKKEIEFPDTLEEFDIGTFGKEFQETKQKEITEAEEEIKSAIEKIKEREKQSLFKRLFVRKGLEKPVEEHLMPEFPEIDDISKIQNNINKARESLMRFDLETAKKNYIEAMKLYNKVKPEEQAKVYKDIKELYFERKSAEELKV